MRDELAETVDRAALESLRLTSPDLVASITKLLVLGQTPDQIGKHVRRLHHNKTTVLLVEGAAFALAREKQSRPDPMRWPDFGDPLQAEEWEDHNESEKG